MEDMDFLNEIIRKSADIRCKLADLSYIDEKRTIELIRIWGNKEMPITPFYATLIESFPINYFENKYKEIS